MSLRSRQRRDKRAEIPDEATLSRLMTNGAEAWRTVPDAAAWVDELRGHTMTDTTDQFQPLRDALAVWPLSTPPVIRQEPPDGCMVWLSDDDAVTVADALAPEWAALIVAAVNTAPALLAEVERLRDTLQFVERWANHHATKPHMTPQEALSTIQHHPHIKAITLGYADGKVPDTPDPWAEVERLTAELAAARVDAERWQWWRAQTRGQRDERGRMEFVCPDPHPLGNIMQGSVAQHLDKAVDAARTA